MKSSQFLPIRVHARERCFIRSAASLPPNLIPPLGNSTPPPSIAASPERPPDGSDPFGKPGPRHRQAARANAQLNSDPGFDESSPPSSQKRAICPAARRFQSDETQGARLGSGPFAVLPPQSGAPARAAFFCASRAFCRRGFTPRPQPSSRPPQLKKTPSAGSRLRREMPPEAPVVMDRSERTRYRAMRQAGSLS